MGNGSMDHRSHAGDGDRDDDGNDDGGADGGRASSSDVPLNFALSSRSFAWSDEPSDPCQLSISSPSYGTTAADALRPAIAMSATESLPVRFSEAPLSMLSAARSCREIRRASRCASCHRDLLSAQPRRCALVTILLTSPSPEWILSATPHWSAPAKPPHSCDRARARVRARAHLGRVSGASRAHLGACAVRPDDASTLSVSAFSSVVFSSYFLSESDDCARQSHQ